MSIKKVIDSKGKTKYQAQVWFKGEFISSGTFDSQAQARGYQKECLAKVAANKMGSAAERREQRLISAGLDRSMLGWAELYIEHPEHPLSHNRKNEYLLVGRLTADYTATDLSATSSLPHSSAAMS